MTNDKLKIANFSKRQERICHLSSVICHTARRRGFTLVETVASLGILMLGIGASLTLMVSVLAYSRQTENMIVVVNLSREGIEMVRGIRDTAGFASVPAGSWLVDANSSALASPALLGGGGDILSCTNCDLNLSGGQYLHNAGTVTPYRRYVRISDLSSFEKQVTSFVGWTEHARSHAYSLNTILTDWQ